MIGRSSCTHTRPLSSSKLFFVGCDDSDHHLVIPFKDVPKVPQSFDGGKSVKQGSVTPVAAGDVGDPEKCVWANAKVASQSSCCTGGKQGRGSVTLLEGGSCCSSVRPMNLLLSNLAAPHLKIHHMISSFRLLDFDII